MEILFNDLRPHLRQIEREVEEAIHRVIKNGRFILGEEGAAFEREFAEYCGAEYAVGVANGTEALWLSLLALNVGPGDEVITTANTALPTVTAISMAGAIPVLVDIDPLTFNMAPSSFESAITPRTKVVIPVHLYGQPADMSPVLDIARDRGLRVIEDCCQAHGAVYKGRRVGTLGDVAAFSFYPTKNLGALGDGGMAVTNSGEIAERVRLLRHYGQRDRYYQVIEGYNSRLDEVQAAVLRVKLRYLDDWNAERRRLATLYDSHLSHVVTPTKAESSTHIFHLYVVRARERDALQRSLSEKGIQTAVHYPVPNHRQPAYTNSPLAKDGVPESERAAGEILSLPLYPGISDDQIANVADAIASFYARV